MNQEYENNKKIQEEVFVYKEQLTQQTVRAIVIEKESAELALQNDKHTKAMAELAKNLATSDSRVKEFQLNISKLEVDHDDLARKLSAEESKSNQMCLAKETLEKELELVRSSSLDSNSELGRVTEQLKLKQKALESLQESSNRFFFKYAILGFWILIKHLNLF